jgi:hypothetical protein
LGDGHLDRGELCLDVCVGAVEALEGVARGVDSVGADEVPGGFDGEGEANRQEGCSQLAMQLECQGDVNIPTKKNCRAKGPR